MCRPLPHPRCTPHALERLQRAEESGIRERIINARTAYEVTRGGLEELRETNPSLYQTRLQDRERMITEYRELYWQTEMDEGERIVLAYTTEREDVMESIAQEGSPELTRILVHNPALTPHVLDTLLDREVHELPLPELVRLRATTEDEDIRECLDREPAVVAW